jgi:hypothetical protein
VTRRGVGHTAADNGRQPALVAAELRPFFAWVVYVREIALAPGGKVCRRSRAFRRHRALSPGAPMRPARGRPHQADVPEERIV